MEKHFKQLIIARRDLNMSPGKLAAQVSSAFLIEMIRDSWPGKTQGFYQVNYRLDEDIYDNWINNGVTKVVNRGKLEKAIEKAKELGMIDFLGGEDELFLPRARYPSYDYDGADFFVFRK